MWKAWRAESVAANPAREIDEDDGTGWLSGSPCALRPGDKMDETELKFALAPAALKPLRARAAQLAGRRLPTRGRQVTSTYFDTAGRDLHQNGIALRLRRDGGRWVQTVKASAGLTAGLQTAQEADAVLTDGRLDLAAIPDAALARQLSRVIEGHDLVPLCETAMQRIRTDVTSADGSRVAIVFDTGEIRANGAAQPFAELELELIDGNLAALYEIARALFDAGRPAFSTLSKPERGALLAETGRIEPEPAPRKAHPSPVGRKQPAEDAAQAVLREAFAQIAANVAAVAAGDDPEGPHRLRVGLRRLRTAMLLFRPVIGCPEMNRLGAEARWLGQEAGALRDLDVAIDGIVAPASAAHPAEPGFATLLAALGDRRTARRAALRAVLDAPRTGGFLLDLAQFIETRGWQGSWGSGPPAPAAAPLRDVARDALARRWRTVARRARGIETLPADARHELRKALKKLRYGVDFLGPVFKPKSVRDFIQHLKTLQDLFGDLNDLAMAEALLTGPDAPAGTDPAAQRAVGLILGARGVRAELAWRQARQLWDEVKAAPKFWR
ncbi:MAG: CHAD domain-containing protein [Rhodobacteraceae bacterium]|nr:CHAD domain-containing protein [Paracoccaceae bacterium]